MSLSFTCIIWLPVTTYLAGTSGRPRSSIKGRFILDVATMYVGLPRFHEAFFGRVAGLKTTSEAIFKKCMEGGEPLFSNGWSGWPTDANQDHVLSWFAELNEKLEKTQPNKPVQGFTAEQKLDVGFVDNPKARKDSRYHWSHILVPGELKSNPSADIYSKAWLDIGTYAREVLAAQDTRRFVLGFTICGSLMRIWEFDRLGGIASERFDINTDGLQFVSTVLGFLCMSEKELGFDLTIRTANDKRFIEIERDGLTERLVIDEVMQRARCIAGRAITCWKAYREGYTQIPLVIKDSWQYPERDEEGELLREATNQGVVNVARYYYHETASGDVLSNRVHRRVILRNYGKSIYKVSSRSALLAALEGCIEGHESLQRKAGLLHRDISINNLMINEDDDNLSWPSFLIDLDLAVREQRDGASGAKGKAGTRVFMAIGVLLGEQHSFMHDVESFFWVLFWICIHYDAQGKDIGPTEFDSWNYEGDNKLVRPKAGRIGDESIFLKIAEENFTSYYQPLIPLVNRLRRKVFPNGER
ncbi:hypothetical protein B0H67DRAFT_634722 [Lasiosphaeris hirsuta]|uniref:non-specific serine/threonine protein kinase n=1 Tax=Lasiosphaeris hirsuta TaxID=260670 RepID=A0AA40AGG4_9PEZI|nr:hypothetical protein B0H67DRAFT_634722 [Lasiosphaeris hirsuta]